MLSKGWGSSFWCYLMHSMPSFEDIFGDFVCESAVFSFKAHSLDIIVYGLAMTLWYSSELDGFEHLVPDGCEEVVQGFVYFVASSWIWSLCAAQLFHLLASCGFQNTDESWLVVWLSKPNDVSQLSKRGIRLFHCWRSRLKHRVHIQILLAV